MLKYLPSDVVDSLSEEALEILGYRPCYGPVTHLPRVMIGAQASGSNLVLVCGNVIPERGPFLLTRGFSVLKLRSMQREDQLPSGIRSIVSLPSEQKFGRYLHRSEYSILPRGRWQILARCPWDSSYKALGALEDQGMIVIEPVDLVDDYDARLNALDAVRINSPHYSVEMSDPVKNFFQS